MKFIKENLSIFWCDIKFWYSIQPNLLMKIRFLFIKPALWAIITYRIGRLLCGNQLGFFIKKYFFDMFIGTPVKIITGIEIYPETQIGKEFYIEHFGGVFIHPTTIIGNHCKLYHGVTLGADPFEKEKLGPIIGNQVYIGAGAKVIGHVTIGNNVIIGAGAIVVKDIAENSVVAGNPARIICKITEENGEKYKW